MICDYITPENRVLLDRYVELSAATSWPITHEDAVNLALSVLLPDWVEDAENDVRQQGMTTQELVQDIAAARHLRQPGGAA
ncbi:MAG: hypothetical protein H6733_10110 [Alphaproteobacteria bacterium]|nr:hypothetical protein [Alphaproteobacteria bacterium]